MPSTTDRIDNRDGINYWCTPSITTDCLKTSKKRSSIGALTIDSRTEVRGSSISSIDLQTETMNHDKCAAQWKVLRYVDLVTEITIDHEKQSMEKKKRNVTAKQTGDQVIFVQLCSRDWIKVTIDLLLEAGLGNSGKTWDQVKSLCNETKPSRSHNYWFPIQMKRTWANSGSNQFTFAVQIQCHLNWKIGYRQERSQDGTIDPPSKERGAKFTWDRTEFMSHCQRLVDYWSVVQIRTGWK